jgi:transposase
MTARSLVRPRRPHSTGSRTEPITQLTDNQWFLIEDLFPDPEQTSAGGRPPHPNRACFEGILFVLISGCRWKDLPSCFPSKSVCHARFKRWTESGLFQIAWERLLELKSMIGQLELSTLLGDGTFVPAKKGAAA